MTLVHELPLFALFAGLLTTAGMLSLLIRFAPRLKLIAIANARSSHVNPTPTGGGIAIGLPVILWCALSPEPLGFWLAVSGGVLALTGLVDDLIELPAWPRFLLQAVCVAGFLHATEATAGGAALIIIGLLTLWFVNLFNFMDGIDGIAGTQTLLFGLGVLLLSGATLTWIESLVWLVVGSSFAFLLYNWHPAKIFMGDAGALLLGLCLPAIVLALDAAGDLPFVASLILLAVFVFDATWTLGVRIITGQRFTAAHRSHLYQRLASRWGHGQTSLAFVFYACLWLFPLAWWAKTTPGAGVWLLLASVAPLMALAVRFRAGMPDQDGRERTRETHATDGSNR
ncbi:MAG: glycosyl transferase family 4 [Gammaproteobacteria bacterium]|nr:glycosyl transferase family 4 [Gammaproteobacteria bacterium]